MKEDKYSFATWLRVFAMVLILLCHFFQRSNNTYLDMAAQFFNVGNNIFFVLSGFLFGIQNKKYNFIFLLYQKRIKRIYIPNFLMIFIFFIINIILKKDIILIQWILQFLAIQGWYTVDGATHTWFITSLLLCYLITPLFSKLEIIISNRKRAVSMGIVLIFFPVLLAYTIHPNISSLLVPVCWYTIAYFMGKNFYKINITNKTLKIASTILIISFLVRIIARYYYDNTIFYNQVIAWYTHAISSYCIFFIFAFLFKNKKAPTIIYNISNISYEIYLWHFMFTEGPLKIYNLPLPWIICSTIIVIISVFVAYLFNKISKKIYMYI